MDLQTRTTIWTHRAPLELALGRLSSDVDCDVLVVGTGITGALMAHRLAEAGCDVVMVDKRSLARGSTIASTALIQYEIDVPLVCLAERIGVKAASDVYRQTRAALDDLRTLVAHDNFDCEFRRRPTMFLGCDASDERLLRAEADARRSIGIEASYLDAGSLKSGFGITRPGAVRSEVSYELNPWKLTIALLESAVRRGVRIFDRTGLLAQAGNAPTPNRPLETDAGYTITCGHVVFATGYETPEQFPQLKSLCEMRTTFALVSEPVELERMWPERALLWEHADPYFYARTTADDRVILGGEDEPLMSVEGREAALPAKRDELLASMAKLLPTFGPIEASRIWGATFAQTADGLPFIGSPDGTLNCHFALGYGGNGITFSLIAAKMIANAILGDTRVEGGPFSFDRALAWK